MRNTKEMHKQIADTSAQLDSDIVPVPCGDDELFGGEVSPVHGVRMMGRDPLETIMLSHIVDFYNLSKDHIRMVQSLGTCSVNAAPFLDRAIVLSKHVERLHNAVRKYRGRGEQKMIVEHRTVLASTERAKHGPARRRGSEGNLPGGSDRKLVTT